MKDSKSIVLLTNKIEPSTYENCTEKRDMFLLVIFQTPMLFSYDGKHYFKILGDSLIVYSPNTLQAYKSNGGIVQNSFMYLDKDETYFKSKNIPLDTLIILKKEFIEELVFELDRLSYIVNTPYAESLVVKIPEYVDKFFNLLSKHVSASDNIINNSPLISSLTNIRSLMFKEPEKYTARRMAFELGYTETYFGIKYKEAFGITPNQDRKLQMIKKIKKLLLETDYTLDTIAEICCIKSTAHLINIFKSVEKITPYQYKKLH